MTERKSSGARGYGSRWQKARATFLRTNPLCVFCQQQGKTVAAQVVDHKVPHKGDQSLLWDTSNWQPLCTRCHNSHKQRLEKSGAMTGCDTSGKPLDPNHPWNRPGVGW